MLSFFYYLGLGLVKTISGPSAAARTGVGPSAAAMSVSGPGAAVTWPIISMFYMGEPCTKSIEWVGGLQIVGVCNREPLLESPPPLLSICTWTLVFQHNYYYFGHVWGLSVAAMGLRPHDLWYPCVSHNNYVQIDWKGGGFKNRSLGKHQLYSRKLLQFISYFSD